MGYYLNEIFVKPNVLNICGQLLTVEVRIRVIETTLILYKIIDMIVKISKFKKYIGKIKYVS